MRPECNGVSLSAYGNGKPLDEALAFIAKKVPNLGMSTGVGVIELAIGAKPIDDPVGSTSDFQRQYNVTFTGHNAMPIGVGCMVRPESTEPNRMMYLKRMCGLLRIRRYSAHAPSMEHFDKYEFFDWAWRWYNYLGEAGIKFSVETMYPAPYDPRSSNAPRHLSNAQQVEQFLKFADSRGWSKPLLVDLAHLHIGWTAGAWKGWQIEDLLNEKCYEEVHYSTNDGVRDQHLPLERVKTEVIESWLQTARKTDVLFISEGRVRNHD